MPVVRLSGSWVEVGQTLNRLGDQKFMERMFEQSLSREAHRLQRQIVQGFTRQGAGGVRWAPLSEMTLELRARRGFGGTKALIDRADLRNSIKVKKVQGRDSLGRFTTHGRGASAAYFVGVHRTARSSRGGPLVNIAIIQEGGATIKIFGGSTTAKIPARPFIGPVWALEKGKSSDRIMNDFRRGIIQGRIG